MTGISKSQVSRLCEKLDERVQAFLNRPIEGEWPYLWLDATYIKTRQAGRIVSVAATLAAAVNTDGVREILGLRTGPSEAEPFWTDFLRSLSARGLGGVKLVIADAHPGPKSAAAKVLGGTLQRCKVHFLRNALAHAGKQGAAADGARADQHRLRPGESGGGLGAMAHGHRSATRAFPEARRVLSLGLFRQLFL